MADTFLWRISLSAIKKLSSCCSCEGISDPNEEDLHHPDFTQTVSSGSGDCEKPLDDCAGVVDTLSTTHPPSDGEENGEQQPMDEFCYEMIQMEVEGEGEQSTCVINNSLYESRRRKFLYHPAVSDLTRSASRNSTDHRHQPSPGERLSTESEQAEFGSDSESNAAVTETEENVNERPKSSFLAALVCRHKISFAFIFLPFLIRLLNTIGEIEGSTFESLYRQTWFFINVVCEGVRFHLDWCFQNALSTHLIGSSTLFVLLSAVWFCFLLKGKKRKGLQEIVTKRLVWAPKEGTANSGDRCRLSEPTRNSSLVAIEHSESTPTINPLRCSNSVTYPETTLRLMEFRVDASDDYNSLEWDRQRDVDWFYKHCVATSPVTLRGLDWRAWTSNGHRRERSQWASTSNEQIGTARARGDWWLSQLHRIQSDFLRTVIQFVFEDPAATSLPAVDRRPYTHTLFDRIQQLWEASEVAPLPPPVEWKHRPVFARLVISRREAVRIIKQLLYETNPVKARQIWEAEQGWERTPNVESGIPWRRHTSSTTATEQSDNVGFEKSLTLDFIDSLEMHPIQLDINCDWETKTVQGAVKEFETSLFKGRMLLRLAGLPSTGFSDYFDNRKRLMQFVVQGRFKQRLPMDHVFTGQVWKHPFSHLPHRWLVRIAIGLIARVLPSVVCEFEGDRPYFLLPLVASLQTLAVHQPNDPLPNITDENLQEDSRLLLGPGESNLEWARNREQRRRFFSQPDNLSGRYFEPGYIYTMETYQHLFDTSSYQIRFPFKSLHLADYIDHQPVAVGAFFKRRFRSSSSLSSSSTHLTPPEYLWNVELCHEELINDWL